MAISAVAISARRPRSDARPFDALRRDRLHRAGRRRARAPVHGFEERRARRRRAARSQRQRRADRRRRFVAGAGGDEVEGRPAWRRRVRRRLAGAQTDQDRRRSLAGEIVAFGARRRLGRGERRPRAEGALGAAQPSTPKSSTTSRLWSAASRRAARAAGSPRAPRRFRRPRRRCKRGRPTRTLPGSIRSRPRAWRAATQFNFAAKRSGDAADVNFSLDAGDGSALMRQLGVAAAAGGGGRAHLEGSAKGRWDLGFDTLASGTLSGADFTWRGRLRPTADADEASLFGSATLKADDVSGLLAALGLAKSGGVAAPVDLSADSRLARRPARVAAPDRKRGGIESRRQADLAARRGRGGRSRRRAGAVDRRRNAGLEGGSRAAICRSTAPTSPACSA